MVSARGSHPKVHIQNDQNENTKIMTNYGKHLMAYKIPDLVKKIKDTIGFTKSLNSFKACTRQKLVENDIIFDLWCSVLHMRIAI